MLQHHIDHLARDCANCLEVQLVMTISISFRNSDRSDEF